MRLATAALVLAAVAGGANLSAVAFLLVMFGSSAIPVILAYTAVFPTLAAVGLILYFLGKVTWACLLYAVSGLGLVAVVAYLAWSGERFVSLGQKDDDFWTIVQIAGPDLLGLASGLILIAVAIGVYATTSARAKI